MPDCFISYSTKDEDFARAVHRHLEAEGLDVFMAGVSIRPGHRWSERIQSALQESDWVVFLASREACTSPWVQQEVGRAVGGSKRLVPVVWDMAPKELPAWVSDVQALDLQHASSDQVRERIVEIAARIKQDKTRGLLLGGALIAGLLYLASRSD